MEDTGVKEEVLYDGATEDVYVVENEPEPIEPPKSGWRTSEFWLVAATVLVGLLNTSGLFEDTTLWAKVIGGAISVLAALGYSWNRSQVKIENGAG